MAPPTQWQTPHRAPPPPGGRKSPATKKTPKTPKTPNSAPPPAPSASVSIDYAQEQRDEVEALQAIYAEEYEDVPIKGAWSKASDKAFRLRLRDSTDSEISLVLFVQLTATYPKTSPIISMEDPVGIRPKAQKAIRHLLQSKPKELIGQVMIHDIALAVLDVLAVEAEHKAERKAMPSLEEERAEQQAATSRLAQEQEEFELKKKEAEAAEEQRSLQELIEKEHNRQTDLRRKNKSQLAPLQRLNSNMTPNADFFNFDRPVAFQNGGETVVFRSVTGFTKLPTGPLTAPYTVRPVADESASPTYRISKGQDDELSVCPALLVLKQVTIRQPKDRHSQLKNRVERLEECLENLRNLPSHGNVLGVLDFVIRPVIDGWQVSVLAGLATKGSLEDMLSTFHAVPLDRARPWTVEILEAVDFYHKHGVVHRRIHPGNILLSQSSTGSPMNTVLADCEYQDYLYEIKNLSKPSQRLSARSSFWIPPEGSSIKSRKTDIWDLGVVFLQMLFGADIPDKHNGPASLRDTLPLTAPLDKLIGQFFHPTAQHRPNAFNLIPSEFLRNDVELLAGPISSEYQGPSSSASLPQLADRFSRRGSNPLAGVSRYEKEWVEVGRLGKGGYGEVVKARNKLDHCIYAIKKVRQNSESALTKVLSEVMLLSRLNHPYVVRYYTAWPEADFAAPISSSEEAILDDESSSELTGAGEGWTNYGQSTGGLDFINSDVKGEFGDDIVFGYSSQSSEASDDDDDEQEQGENQNEAYEEDDEDSDDFANDVETGESPKEMTRQRRHSSTKTMRPVKSTLYIQMEYCEKQTLRDLIKKGLPQSPEESWRLFRQILEGLVHIHSLGIIHRDLKPDNIFIDNSNNPRIGDFGLATTGQYQVADTGVAGSGAPGEMTRSIGTALYVAPELRTGASGTYNDKVDMYSLGIIFFEMCYPLNTLMERIKTIEALRQKEHNLPSELQVPEKALQSEIIESLVSHRPAERPTSAELLRSGKIPVKIEDETIRVALDGLSDPNSPYYHKMMSALFSQNPDRQAKEYTWDHAKSTTTTDSDANHLLLQGLVKERLSMIFRRHGAVETQRQLLLPRSAHNTHTKVVQLLDSSGTLVQLPFDLTLPYARAIARKYPAAEKTFTFGRVYREASVGGPPVSTKQADFDIVSKDTLDLALKEAEVIKVMDEVIEEFPAFASSPMCFWLNHSDLLELIMDFSRVDLPQRPAVKEVLSKLNVYGFDWQQARTELRSSGLGISSTSLDDMVQFDFRETPQKAFAKLRSIFSEKKEYLDRTRAIFSHLETIINYLDHFEVKRKTFIYPLSCYNEKFYAGGVLFQCVVDTKRRDILAAGGRYDHLIQELRFKVQPQDQGTSCHAVGMHISWDRLVTGMTRYQRSQGKSATFLKSKSKASANSNQDKEKEVTSAIGPWFPRRCDVLVAAFDPTVLRTTGVRTVAELWAHDISAELAFDARSHEMLMNHYRDSPHAWLVIIKHDHAASAASAKPDVKVKNLLTRTDTDVKSENLVQHLRAELRERDHRDKTAVLQAQRPLGGAAAAPMASERKQNVHVLIAQHRSKKSNKWHVVESAQTRAQALLGEYSEAPIVAVETRDEVLDGIRGLRLSDSEGWRRLVQSLPVADRDYVRQMQQLLEGFRAEWLDDGGTQTGVEGRSRMAFVHNFRTGHIVLFDLGL
ncbi:Serine/threonine-protein kinase [Trichodelitschia bisporula]|uniref:non-specific serine/threonine protein kinase n=1 Tax=Trichodelitschia bisporula TaxID=703511 RepID=A0A6G1I939_9PEZI|nr:Serine/threonine-protein kinase [Trichodelitschia bisporula]